MKKKVKANRYFSWPHYFLLLFACTILRMRFHASAVKSKAFKEQKRKGPMLVLCNHTSALDFAYFTTPFFPKKVSFVVAENMMYSTKMFAGLIKGYHAITKKQFYADFTCIKTIKKYLDAGISVIICPEGKVSAEGRTGSMQGSITRLVKWLGHPVATVVTRGAGLTRPKWAHNCRTGKIVSECDILFTAEQVKELSNEEIMAGIEKGLYHNEHEYQIQNKRKFRGKEYAEGLERLLYQCPKCGTEFSISAKEDELCCSACGNTVVYEHTGGLVPKGEGSTCPERIDIWYDMERDNVAKEVEKEDFAISKPVFLFTENEEKNGYRYIASGELSLDKTNLAFHTEQLVRPKNVDSDFKINGMTYDVSNNDEGTEAVEEEFRHMVFAIKNFTTIANIPGDSLDIYDEKHTYRLMFASDKASTKYVLAIEELGRIREEQKKN